MALFQLMLASAFHLAAASFNVVSPSLEAEMVLKKDQWWHLGGFCFGRDDGAPVAKLVVRVQWQGERPLDASTKVYLLAFDGRKDYWGVAQQEWETAGCERKLQVATDSAELHEPFFQKVLPPNVEQGFAINIRQKTAMRDWHYAVMACGSVEAAPLKLTVEAVSGALSVFAANDNFDESSCPVMPISWWQEAQVEAGFWLLLCAVAICSACFGFIFLMVSQWLFSRNKRAYKESTDANQEVVIGKPCQALDGDMDIANGQINAENVKSNPKVSPEDV
ncbi:Uncharacterized protein SCF082_LOCUS49601 [Durusdinium trenchii]|uniref:DOMON domain-containing protein n=1 Tax=Durusdinium trenchii TaxID=1381693 RepID=A0ABP0S2C7_9DINO